MKELFESISQGRGALAVGTGDRGNIPNSPVSHLLLLLWHNEREVRQAAARSLPGGDREQYYEAHYGYFVEAFLRELTTRHALPPELPAERYAAVGEVLGDLIGQSARDIRAMSGMHYSFLSSALYLALFATCRDALLAAARLRASEVQEALCDLLWNLSAVAGIGRLNPQDILLLMDRAGHALTALPPDEIPAFWDALNHPNATRRNAVSPALRHLSDTRAVPYLLAALPLQQPEIAEPLIVSLGRLADKRALPLLGEFSQSPHRNVSKAARSAIGAIQRAQKLHPTHTLLRPSAADNRDLLRSAANGTGEPDTLLRPTTEFETDGGRRCD